MISNICHVVLNSEHDNRFMAIFWLRIFIATLKMYSLTGWADQAEISRIVKKVDLRTAQKISSRSDTYGRFYRLKMYIFKVAIKIRNQKMAISRWKNFVKIFLSIFVFRIQNYLTYVRHQKSCTFPLS